MKRQLTYLGLLGYLLIGTSAVLVPSVMPFITSEFSAAGLTLAAIGLIFPAQAVGGILGNLLSGIGSDLMGRQRLVWFAALLLSISLALAAVAAPWLLFLASFLFISATQGALSTGINAMIADANRDGRARALNLLHGVYGVGAAISPLIFGYLFQRGLQWRFALSGTGLLWLIYAATVYLLHRAKAEREPKRSMQKLDWGMFRQANFLALFVVAFVYNGIAWSLLGWIALFMQRSAGFSAFLSLSMISVFYVALTTGRFLCAAFAERIGYITILLLLTAGIALTYPLVLISSNSLLITVGVFLTGLSLSGLFPTALAIGARFYPQQTGAVTGTLNIAMTIGSMFPPLWTGLIADRWSFQIALGVNYLMVLLLIGAVLYLRGVEQHRVLTLQAE